MIKRAQTEEGEEEGGEEKEAGCIAGTTALFTAKGGGRKNNGKVHL